MAIWAWLIIAVGIAGFFLPERDSQIYIMGSTVAVLLAVLIPVVRIFQWTRRLPEGVSQTSTMASGAMAQTSEAVSVSSIFQKRTLIPVIVLGLLCVAYVIYIYQSAQWLPERVATHFGAGGRANDWMYRESYLQFITILGPAIAGLIGLFGVVIAILQLSMKSRVAGSSRQQNLSYLGGDILWFACLLLCFLAGTHRLVVEANRSHPAHLPGTGFGMLVAAFALGNIAWAALLIFHIMKRVRPG